jgi:hypothetical protein
LALQKKFDTTLVLVLAILKFFDASLILVLGSNIDFGLVYGKYMLGIQTGMRLVLPQVPTSLYWY